MAHLRTANLYYLPMRNRTYLVLGTAQLALLLACNGDGSNATGGSESGDSGNADSTGAPATSSPGDSSDTVSPDTGSGSVDTTASSDGSESGCSGECQTADDCMPGQSCLACVCVGEPTGCAQWGAGAFGDCVAEGNGACEGNGTCIVDNPNNATAGVCFAGCEMPCDCPQPPAGFETQVACEDLTGEGDNDCFIDCSSDPCPDGMFCFMDTLCFWGDAPEDVPPYGDCVNAGAGQCAEGICISDDPADPTFGACFSPCMDAGDCPASPGGTAVVSCDNITNDNMPECFLDCSGGATCPDGMACIAGFNLCAWEVVAPPEPGYGNCNDLEPAMACLETETCFTDDTGSICSGTCTMPADCPPAPASGDAPVACADVGAGAAQCYLDCSGGQTCPDGAVCVDNSYCHYEDPLLFESFEGGELPAGWTVVDVDMLTPDMNVSFVDAAWVVSDAVEAGDNFAAYSTSWYAPAGVSDDWLITPQVTPNATSVLSWEGFTVNGNFADGYEVRVSTATTDVADFADVLLTVPEENTEWTSRSLDLSAYAGMPIYIAFRNNSDDKLLLLIDNIRVSN